ncbi:MAG: sugar transferase, partial [bacterium]|nr:sugar transferase [bacterium]
NILIIGANKEVDDLIQALSARPQIGYRITAIIDLAVSTPDINLPAFQNLKIIRSIANLPEIVKENSVKTIVSAIDPRENPRLLAALYQCFPYKVSFSDLAAFYENVIGKTPLSIIGEVWFLENLMRSEKQIFDASKRVFDFIAAGISGIITLPFYPLIALAVKLESPGPIFYFQKRVGKEGKIFRMVKFRSMARDAEKNGVRWAQKSDNRVTKVGRILRKTRLDELPQLWNVFLGQMSFVGPRPERPEFVELLKTEIPFYQMRHLVKPGISGWAQINFPYGSSVSDAMEKLQYDLYYIKNRSFILDIGIVLKTINIILRREGV